MIGMGSGEEIGADKWRGWTTISMMMYAVFILIAGNQGVQELKVQFDKF
jgi:hypothetical protein